MNHEEAIRSEAAAGYLLGDLPAAEREAFEEHFFDCRECGDAVRAGATMLATGREVVESDSSFRRFRTLKAALSGAAAAAIVVIAAYQTAVIPRLQSRATPPVMEILRPTDAVVGASRGEASEEQTIRFNGDETLVLYRDIPDEPRFSQYQVEIRTAAGEVLKTADVSEELTRRLVSSGELISISVRPLPAGRYVLAIRGVREDGNRPEIAQYSVVVVR